MIGFVIAQEILAAAIGYAALLGTQALVSHTGELLQHLCICRHSRIHTEVHSMYLPVHECSNVCTHMYMRSLLRHHERMLEEHAFWRKPVIDETCEHASM